MRLWIFIFLKVSCSNGIHLRETEYECGAHGRFEYCIDGVPGCVIGCHCHPGYYFDTDTKICEPNVKLSQNYRRNYETFEPTRVFLTPTPPTIEEPATTVSNAVDEKIDIIAKDADDLGDWLYNQFFKTIENQVINETKDDSIITRRSESAPTSFRKPTRRSHRYWKARRKKKKKKKGLKSKLLRITEDDSLFDSSSASSSDESSDSSGSSPSEESHEKHTPSHHKEKNNDHGHKKIVVFNKRPKLPLPSFIFLPNMDTPFFPPIGLPPPPLPMYPMVPVPPMMGPFPFPAAAPPPTAATTSTSTQPPTSSSSLPNNKVPEEKTPSSNSPADTNADINPSEDKEQDQIPPEENSPDDSPPDPSDDKPQEDLPPSLLRGGKKRHGPRNKLVQKLREKLKRKNKLQNFFAKEYEMPPVPPDFMQTRADYLPNLRHKPLAEIEFEDEMAALQDVDFKYLSQLIHRADLNKSNQTLKITTPAPIKDVLTMTPPHRRNYENNYPDQITQILSDLTNQPSNHIRQNQPVYDSPNQLYNVPHQPSYNSLNQPTNNMVNPPVHNIPDQPNYYSPNLPNNNLPNLSAYNLPKHPNNRLPNHSTYNSPIQPTHNAGNQPTYISLNQPVPKVPYRKKIEDTNDVYYANLGRQIASMIRNIDGDKEVDIEIKSSSSIPNNPVLPDHGGSRSYWERFARSPYKHIMNSYKKQINILKLDNENLFELESQVEMAASTEPTLNLHQLENIISKMHKTKSKFIQRNGSLHHAAKPSKSSFNVNLLPGNDQHFHSNGKVTNKAQNILPRLTNMNNSFSNTNTKRQNIHSPIQLPIVPRSSSLHKVMYRLKAPGKILNTTTPNANTNRTSTNAPKTILFKKPDQIVVPHVMYRISNPNLNSYTYTGLPGPHRIPALTNMQQPYVQATTSRTYYQQLSPMVLNHKAVKYYDGINNNQYVYEKASIPFRPQAFQISQIAQAIPYETFGKRVKPSYLHHEVRHFDYFEDLL